MFGILPPHTLDKIATIHYVRGGERRVAEISEIALAPDPGLSVHGLLIVLKRLDIPTLEIMTFSEVFGDGPGEVKHKSGLRYNICFWGQLYMQAFGTQEHARRAGLEITSDRTELWHQFLQARDSKELPSQEPPRVPQYPQDLGDVLKTGYHAWEDLMRHGVLPPASVIGSTVAGLLPYGQMGILPLPPPQYFGEDAKRDELYIRRSELGQIAEIMHSSGWGAEVERMIRLAHPVNEYFMTKEGNKSLPPEIKASLERVHSHPLLQGILSR